LKNEMPRFAQHDIHPDRQYFGLITAILFVST
jgi:hypothetical protein